MILSPLLIEAVISIKNGNGFFNFLMILFLVLAAFAAWFVISFNKEYLFTIGIFNFKRRVVMLSLTEWLRYDTLEFDIQSQDNAHLLLVHAEGKYRGRSAAGLDLLVWQSESLAQVEEVHHLLRAQYEQGMAGAYEYDLRKQNSPVRKIIARYGFFIAAGVFAGIGFAIPEFRSVALELLAPVLLGCNAYMHLRQKWHVDSFIMALAAIALVEYNTGYLTDISPAAGGELVSRVMIFWRCMEVWYLAPTVWFGIKQLRQPFTKLKL